MPYKSSLRAVDFYSGVGGWSLGLHLAGIEVVASYEWWDKANETNLKNNCHRTIECDIRLLDIQTVPQNVDIVVGSPPCTQFSFSNRGGSGDIADGLKDVEKFLAIVDHVSPRFWAMENVPRVASIFEKEIAPGGVLAKYAHLNPTVLIADASDWGVPQKRKRCIIGNFDFELLLSFRQQEERKTLETVVNSLSSRLVTDPVYGTRLGRQMLTDHELEAPLSWEEERMNREMKTFHPVYNNMPFPDPMNQPARTVTAVCTRVSRESIVIKDMENNGKFRRLTLRERACLQGFPINYQFYGKSYSQKLRLIGNALPPPLAYFIAQAIKGTRADLVPSLASVIDKFNPPVSCPVETQPEQPGEDYPPNRRFRAALPNLRFKSGVRFDFSNNFDEDGIVWRVRFFFGSSKNITEVPLEKSIIRALLKAAVEMSGLADCVARAEDLGRVINSLTLQERWSRRSENGHHPYEVVDQLGRITGELISILDSQAPSLPSAISKGLRQFNGQTGFDKILRHSTAVFAGLLVGAAFNSRIKPSPSMSGNQMEFRF